MTAIAHRPSSVMRAYTEQVRDHAAAMERLRDQYLSALRRAEMQYFEGVKRLNESLVQATETVAPAEPVPATDGSAVEESASPT